MLCSIFCRIDWKLKMRFYSLNPCTSLEWKGGKWLNAIHADQTVPSLGPWYFMEEMLKAKAHKDLTTRKYAFLRALAIVCKNLFLFLPVAVTGLGLEGSKLISQFPKKLSVWLLSFLLISLLALRWCLSDAPPLLFFSVFIRLIPAHQRFAWIFLCKWRVISEGRGTLSTHIQCSTNHQSVCCLSSSRIKLKELTAVQQFDGRRPKVFHPENLQFHFISPIILSFHAILNSITFSL